MSVLRILPAPVSAGFVQGLEEVVAHAKDGRLRGAVVLLHYPDSWAHWKGGHIPFEYALTALEAWKWHELSKRFPPR